ncbi:hypothetical protein GCM10025883_23190 [Mobilicoccus caccae]|uniref:Uncharacterized protein n=1 Tax=Mobilicoccus caccae TaxID=1859295 RepID=A0ABQ6IU74_9MICO|nr:hypothetical protein GCM10025883_23190 [Mobilicoccus caccae]
MGPGCGQRADAVPTIGVWARANRITPGQRSPHGTRDKPEEAVSDGESEDGIPQKALGQSVADGGEPQFGRRGVHAAIVAAPTFRRRPLLWACGRQSGALSGLNGGLINVRVRRAGRALRCSDFEGEASQDASTFTSLERVSVAPSRPGTM